FLSWCSFFDRPALCSLSLHDALPILLVASTDVLRVCLITAFALVMLVHQNALADPQALAAGTASPPQNATVLLTLLCLLALLLEDRKSTRLNSSHVSISYAVFCLKKK